MGLAEFLQSAGQGLAQYGQYQAQKKRADQDDAFEAARIAQANDQLKAAEQNRLRDESNASAAQASRSLENAGIYGAGPALGAIASTQGNRVQGQDSSGGAMQDYVGGALGALQQASQAGLPDDQVTGLGNGQYFVPPGLGRDQKPVMGSAEWLSALGALAHVRGDEAIRVNSAKPKPVPSLSAETGAKNQQEKFLQADVDRYIAEAGGDPNKAMTRYYQQKGMGSAQSPEEAAELGDLSTRFNAAGQGYRNKTVTGQAGGGATVKGKIPLSAVSKATRRQWATEAGIPATNDPANVGKMLEWIKANHPEVDTSLR